MPGTLVYAKACAATTLLAGALARLWMRKRRTHENCVEVAAYLRYTNNRVRAWLDEVGCELTDGEIETAYLRIEEGFDLLGDKSD